MKILFLVTIAGFVSYANSITFNVAEVEASNGRFDDLTIREAADLIRKHYDSVTNNLRANLRRRRESGSKSVSRSVLEFETGNVNFDMANLKQGSGFDFSNRQELVDFMSRDGQCNDRSLGVPIKHGFLAAAMTAYNLHLPLELSADDFWLLVAFSVSQHLGQEEVAELYRDQFVNHTGKKELVVWINKYGIYPHGDAEVNKVQWPNAIRDMMNQIIINTDTNFATTMTGNFSTSSTAELTAFRVALMESMKNYFEYTFGILCGIPEITLRGTAADYENLLQRIDILKDLLPDFHWYLNRIRSHAQKLLNTARGTPDVAWWGDFVKVQTFMGCGDPTTTISGWMADWIAYYDAPNSRGGNSLVKLEPRTGSTGISVDIDTLDYPAVTMTEVKLKDFTSGQQHPMIFSGGFLGVSQNPVSGALRPAIGWLTFYKGEAQPVEPIDTSVEVIQGS